MKFRELDIKNEKNILRQVAIWHNLTPKLWLDGYKLDEADVKETVFRIINKETEDISIIVAEDEDVCIGFIWGEKQSGGLMILSLYIEEEYRKKGIATELKVELEEWCIRNDINTIFTTVHSTNEKMLELNRKMGYKANMVSMSKKLK